MLLYVIVESAYMLREKKIRYLSIKQQHQCEEFHSCQQYHCIEYWLCLWGY